MADQRLFHHIPEDFPLFLTAPILYSLPRIPSFLDCCFISFRSVRKHTVLHIKLECGGVPAAISCNDNCDPASAERNTLTGQQPLVPFVICGDPTKSLALCCHSWRVSVGRGKGGSFCADQCSGLILMGKPFCYFGFISVIPYVLFIYYDLEFLLVFASHSTVPEEVTLCVLSDSGSEMRGCWIRTGKSSTRLVSASTLCLWALGRRAFRHTVHHY
jgi:hypothetical protein